MAVDTEIEEVERSSLDRQEARERLERWLAGRLPEGASPTVGELSSPSATGMSSETLLFEAGWQEEGGLRQASLVARRAPDPADVPVFPAYDLEAQYRLLALVAEHGDVPVPPVRWLEPSPDALGAPFFVMDRVEGRVPPDIPPYVFAGWVLEATAEERRRLQDATVRAIAALHAIDPVKSDAGFLDFPVPGATPLARHVQNQRDYYAWVAADGMRHPLLERTFTWLDEHWPAHEGAAVISWGDARIGNVLYDGFEPAALLDWEMAALGPRELDLGWLCFLHDFFQGIAEGGGLPGLPDFLHLADVAARDQRETGHEPSDLSWFTVYAALRHGIVMARIHRRMVHFGHAERTDDPDSVIPHRATLEALLAGERGPR